MTKLEAICKWWGDLLEVEVKREVFAEALFEVLYEAEQADEEVRSIHVDYDPDGTLLKALHMVDIECRGYMFSACGLFPVNSWMVIRDKLVRARSGPGSKRETVWSL